MQFGSNLFKIGLYTMQRKHYSRLLHNCKLKSLILKVVSRSFIKTWNSFAPPCCKYEVNSKRNVILISNHYILCSNDILSLRVYFIKKSKPVSWCCTFRTMKIKRALCIEKPRLLTLYINMQSWRSQFFAYKHNIPW